MKKFIYITYATVFIGFITGCVRDAKNVTLPKVDPKLVVTSFISPADTILKVEITKSKPVLGQQDPYGINNAVENAQVTISDGTQTLQLTYDALAMNYTYPLLGNSNFIKAGSTYFLSVTTPDGKAVSATTTVPVKKIDTATALITIKDVGNETNLTNVINFSFFDIPNEVNYYRIEAYAAYTDDFNGQSITEIYLQNEEEDSWHNLYSDKNRDGKEFKAIEGNYYYSSSNAISQKVFVNVYNTSKEYYDYHKSIDNFQGDNPFSEPVLIYSNIKNGLGVFAGYTTSVVSKAVPNPVFK